MKRRTRQQQNNSRLSSASDGPGMVMFDKEGGYPGNLKVLLEFQAQADDAAVLRRDLYHNAQGGSKSIIFHPRSRMS